MEFKKIEESNEGRKFLKIKSGESIKGVCRGEVYEFYTKWIDGKSHVVTKGAPGAKTRFRINFIVKDESKFIAKIFEFGAMISNQLYEMSQDYDLSETVIKVSRTGSGLDTTYSVIPLKDAPPMGEIKKVELNMLEHAEKPHQMESSDDFGPVPHDPDDGELPF